MRQQRFDLAPQRLVAAAGVLGRRLARLPRAQARRGRAARPRPPVAIHPPARRVGQIYRPQSCPIAIGLPADAADADVTALLPPGTAGDEAAYRRVTDLRYPELRRQAAQYIRASGDRAIPSSPRRSSTRRSCGSPARARWIGRTAATFGGRGKEMRRILVDAARAAHSAKRGEGAEHLPLPPDLQAPGPVPLDVIALDRALDALAALDARKSQVVELRFFGGLTVDETAQVLGGCARYRRTRLAHGAHVAAAGAGYGWRAELRKRLALVPRTLLRLPAWNLRHHVFEPVLTTTTRG